MKNALDTYFQEKTAGFMGNVQQGVAQGMKNLPGALGQAAVGAAAGGAVGLVGAGLGAAASKIMDAVTKRHDFRQMLEYNPELQAHHETNPKFFNQVYSSLRTANPSFAGDPIIAGNYMRRMMDAPEGAGGLLELARTNRPKEETLYGKMSLEGAKAGLKP